MAQRNIFEILGLEFDPPDNLKKIRAAYDKWKKKLTAEINTTVDTNRLSVIKSELDAENYIEQIIENPRLRLHEAEALKQARIEQLRLYIDIQRGDVSGTLQVNQSQIKQIKEKLKLSVATIEATYKEQGFEIKSARTNQKIADTLNEFFLADSVMNELRQNFLEFNQVPDTRNYSWSANVHDLYELAFYIERQESSAEFYKRRDTDGLCKIFRDEAKKVSQPIPAWRSIKAILNLAQTQVFNSDDNRFKYDHSLKLEQLSDFFAKLKAAPEIFKRDKFFADNCINRIRKTFPNLLNYERSAALYNKAAGLLKDPYESSDNSVENSFCVTCANCWTFETFRTREEAERAVCKICGESFYMECPKCGKKVPAVSDHCSACDFSLSELKRYDYYIDYANELLNDVERGAKSIDEDVNKVMAEVIRVKTKAKLVKPEALDIKKIEWRINKINAEFKKRTLIKWAESKMPSLTTPPDEAVSGCMEILRKIKDYRPARERLKLIKPKRPLNISVLVKEGTAQNQNQNSNNASILNKISVNAKSTSLAAPSFNLTAVISWQPDNDLGVVYTVIKKVDGVPKTYHDGEIIVEGTEKLETIDTDIKPGILYGYAVFAMRLGSISDIVTCTVVHYSDIEENKLIAKTEGGYCQFTWRLPSDNCLGVRILRSDNDGNNVVVADCVHSPFVDKLVKNRKQYQYRLQCVYYSAEENSADREKFLNEVNNENFNKVWKTNRTWKYSHGLTVTLTPEFPPRLVRNLNFNILDGKVNFYWQSTGDFDIWFKEISADKKFSSTQIGKIFSLDKLDELLGSGVVLKSAESSEQHCRFSMQGDVMKIAVISSTKDLWLVNEICTAANVEPCEIDESKTQIDTNGLKLVLKSLPKNLYLIHYKIKTEDSEEFFADVEDAKSRHLNRIYATKYAQDTFISQTHLPQKELYITVIGEYKLSDGSTIYSVPSKMILNNRPKSVISYHLEWGTSGLFNKKAQAKNCRLIIESESNETPRLFLVCRKDGRMNIELKDSSTQILENIKEYKKGFPGGRLEISLSDETWEDVSPGTVVKLLTSEEDEKYFELKVSRPDSLTVPKK
ncbi:MAG: hypothetical protein IK062_05825 [Selenomonadaceae bacterium]|nr:hypothetical protein [Selenomonadaceae bacterium]